MKKLDNSVNRSTLYHYLQYDTDLVLRYMKKGRGTFKVFTVPEDEDEWEKSYILINNWRITDFQALVLYTNELVVRFGRYDNCQVNIPYKDIEYIEVHEELDIGYTALYKGNKVQR